MEIFLKPSKHVEKQFINLIKDILKAHGHNVYSHALVNFPESLKEYDHSIIIPHIQPLKGKNIEIGIDLFGFIIPFCFNYYKDVSVAIRGFTNIEFRSIDGMYPCDTVNNEFNYETLILGAIPDFLTIKTRTDEISKCNQIKSYKNS